MTDSSFVTKSRFFVAATALGLLANWPILAPLWRSDSVAAAAGHSATAVALSLVCLLAFSSFRYVGFLLVPLLCLSAALYLHFGVVVNAHLFAGIFQTQPQEVRTFLTLTLLIKLAVGLLLGIGLAWYLKPRTPTRWYRTALGLAALAGYLIIIYAAKPHWAKNSTLFPYNIHRGLSDYLGIRAKTQAKLLSKQNLGNAFPLDVTAVDPDLTLVFVLGESARADHLPFNGYYRQTMPKLTKFANLISFHDVWSCGGDTGRSLPCLMTRATREDRDRSNSETSFVSVLRSARFDTSWISADGRAYDWTIPINTIASEAEHLYFREEATAFLRRGNITPPCEGCDGYHLPLTLDLIRQAREHARSIVVMQTHGSHLEFADRYPKSDALFKPECSESFQNIRNCSLQEVANSYDNTVLYTDHILYELIEKIKDRNALLIYVADHGQHLGEDNEFFHGYLVQDHSRAPIRRVPWLVWASDTYAARHPDTLATMRANSERAISHDYVFHSVLDCIGIKSDVVDRSLSICSEQMSPRSAPPPMAYQDDRLPAKGE